MNNREFFEKLPIVLDALKEAITNEIGNYNDFNFNSYEDLIEKEFRPDTLEIFKGYAEAINSVEENYGNLQSEAKTIQTAMGDYSQGYAWTEEDSEDDFQFDETPFINSEEKKEFIEYLENNYIKNNNF